MEKSGIYNFYRVLLRDNILEIKLFFCSSFIHQLHKDWGKKVSDVVEGTGILALLTLESQSIDEHHAGRVAKQLKSLLKGPRCELLR